MTEKNMVSQQTGNGREQIPQAIPMRRLTPPVDIYETAEELMLIADLPGVEESQLQIEVAQGLLTLEANVGSAEGNSGQSFYRQFKLSNQLEADSAEAALKDGVLTLRLPKAEAAKPKKIAVKTLH